MKHISEFVDPQGLIIEYNNKMELQNGDSLQRLGFFFLLMFTAAKRNKYHEEFLNDFKKYILKEDGLVIWYLKSFSKYFKNNYPQRHPNYIGSGQTSRDQLMSNIWSLLCIEIVYPKHLLVKQYLKTLRKEKIPNGDFLGPEHLSAFWRYDLLNTDNFFKKIYLKTLIYFGDFHNMLSSIYKVIHSYIYRYHCDDVNRIAMVLGSNFYYQNVFSKLSALIYFKYRPAWESDYKLEFEGVTYPVYKYNRPNKEFKKSKNKTGPECALHYYFGPRNMPPLDELFNFCFKDFGVEKKWKSYTHLRLKTK